ncbi:MULTISPECIES: cytochrome c [unclassified Roseitalea]|uniref:c-type cytochrome n=1 Tax=unclassified Roseitalea TaxID=2639107 RepID=UPI00273FDC21|nr:MULTISPECIES: cytochrome c [unclassified Roseitalea]
MYSHFFAMRNTPKTLAAAIACTLSMAAAPVHAQDHAVGEQLYLEACAVCHGTQGRGGGEFGQYLTVEPSNLTVLTQQNDGVFPYLEVFQVVDGRTGVRGHGAADMPIWGNVFEREVGATGGPYGSELLVRARLVALVDYIESLQQE